MGLIGIYWKKFYIRKIGYNNCKAVNGKEYMF
jgi:hypothetical protein